MWRKVEPNISKGSISSVSQDFVLVVSLKYRKGKALSLALMRSITLIKNAMHRNNHMY